MLLINVQRVRRGYYEFTFSTLVDNPNALPEGEVTERMMQGFEKIILAKPEDWLWTHKRWKWNEEDSRKAAQGVKES